MQMLRAKEMMDDYSFFIQFMIFKLVVIAIIGFVLGLIGWDE